VFFCNIFILSIPVKKIKKLGEGGQGSVFAVEDPENGYKYAIKQIVEENGRDASLKEFEILKQKIHHPNIVLYHAMFTEDNMTNIVMELCEEGSVEDYFRKYCNNTPSEEVYK
jgi:serine/threonine protein kinase